MGIKSFANLASFLYLIGLFACSRNDIEIVNNQEPIYHKIDSLNAKAWEHRYTNPNQLIEFTKETLSLSDSLKYTKGKAQALRSVTSHLISTSQFDSAVLQSDNSINLFKSLNDTLGLAICLNLKGLALNGLGDFEKSVLVFKEALFLFENLNDLDGQSKAMNNIGITHFYNDDYEAALNWYFKSMKIRERLPEKGLLATAKINVAMTYKRLGKPDLALQYCTEALNLIKQTEDRKAEMVVLGSIGAAYYDLLDYKKSADAHQKSLKIALELGDKQREALAYTNLGAIEQETGNLDKALQYYKQNLLVLDEIGSRANRIPAHINMAEIYRLKKDWANAMSLSQNMLKIGKENDSQDEIISAYQSFTETYQLMGKHKEALNYLVKYHALKDSIFNEDKIAITEELSAKYESEKKAAQIALNEREIEDLKHKQQLKNLYILLSFFALVAFVSWGSVFYIKQRDKLRRERSLAEKKQELLQNELTYKNRELVNLTNFILEKESANQEIEEKILQVVNRTNLSSVNDELLALRDTIKKSLKINEGHQELINHLQQLNKGFYQQLDEKIPGLTQNEKRLCALLRLNLTSKQISTILNISPESVDMKRYRLRKKIGMETDTYLSEFINAV